MQIIKKTSCIYIRAHCTNMKHVGQISKALFFNQMFSVMTQTGSMSCVFEQNVLCAFASADLFV